MTPKKAFELYAAKAPVDIPGPQRTASRSYRAFAHLLTEVEKRALATAIDHAALGEGRAEFDGLIEQIRLRLGWR